MSAILLHLLHTQPDPQRLAAWAAHHRLLDSQGDLGYALHALLRAAFGEHAPEPFLYLDAAQGLLAYTRLGSAELLQHAALADADASAALGLGATANHGGLSVRPFPSQWPKGKVLSFEVRVRPIIRDGKTGQERDAFLAAVEKTGGVGTDRAAVYLHWLQEQLARQGGAELLDATLDRFRLLDVMRQKQKVDADTPRGRRAVRGPDAVINGHLKVADTEAFAQLLSRGVGRHRAFGFGLLLLRPARAEAPC